MTEPSRQSPQPLSYVSREPQLPVRVVTMSGWLQWVVGVLTMLSIELGFGVGMSVVFGSSPGAFYATLGAVTASTILIAIIASRRGLNQLAAAVIVAGLLTCLLPAGVLAVTCGPYLL